MNEQSTSRTNGVHHVGPTIPEPSDASPSLQRPEGETIDTSSSPFHEGEQQVQARLGIREEVEPWARRVVRPYLPTQHRSFYAQLPFLVMAARDEAGRPWATILSEEPGFVSSADPRSLHVAALPPPGDALAGAPRPGEDVGLLGIELDTRRRNRVNGRIVERRNAGFTLGVDQSFGNCPQYITERHWHRDGANDRSTVLSRGSSLGRQQRDLISLADTFFIASGFSADGEDPTIGLDASHRGGGVGFVQDRSPRHLVFPDYAGNNHFNTLGNLLMDSRAGLLFVDFDRGDLLQLTGRTRIDWDSPEIEAVADARRLVHFEVEEWIHLGGALRIRWTTPTRSIGKLRLIEKRPESADVTSFVLAPENGRALPGFVAGQHLPIQIEVPGRVEPVRRTYSLSGSPDAPNYRMSVKREPLGLVSRHLHDEFSAGQLLDFQPPQGSFILDRSNDRPVVLVSAGVGLTPLVSMLHTLVAHEPHRRVLFVHGARDSEHHPLHREVDRLSESSPNVEVHVAYSQPGPEDSIGRDYHSRGRVDGSLIEDLLPGLGGDFYLCGPPRFMATIQAHLELRGVPPDRIRSEIFGSAS